MDEQKVLAAMELISRLRGTTPGVLSKILAEQAGEPLAKFLVMFGTNVAGNIVVTQRPEEGLAMMGSLVMIGYLIRANEEQATKHGATQKAAVA